MTKNDKMLLSQRLVYTKEEGKFSGFPLTTRSILSNYLLVFKIAATNTSDAPPSPLYHCW